MHKNNVFHRKWRLHSMSYCLQIYRGIADLWNSNSSCLRMMEDMLLENSTTKQKHVYHHIFTFWTYTEYTILFQISCRWTWIYSFASWKISETQSLEGHAHMHASSYLPIILSQNIHASRRFHILPSKRLYLTLQDGGPHRVFYTILKFILCKEMKIPIHHVTHNSYMPFLE
jgi:hypothetical protein